ncbi:hypothetical protein D3C71_1442540 [compost metagenome]
MTQTAAIIAQQFWRDVQNELIDQPRLQQGTGELCTGLYPDRVHLAFRQLHHHHHQIYSAAVRRKRQLLDVLRPGLSVRLQACQPGCTRLINHPMLRRDAILAVEDNAQRLAQVFTRINALSFGVQLIPTNRQ